MTLQKLNESYDFLVTEWVTRNNYTITDHVKDIIINLLLHRDKIVNHGGSFIQAFLANNLYNVIRFADNDVMSSLRTIYQAYQNIDTYYLAKSFKDALEQQQTTL